MLTQLLVRDNLLKVLILRFIWVALSTKHEGHLLQRGGVLALFHQYLNQIHAVHLLCNSHGFRVSFELFVDVKGGLEGVPHLVSVS